MSVVKQPSQGVNICMLVTRSCRPRARRAQDDEVSVPAAGRRPAAREA